MLDAHGSGDHGDGVDAHSFEHDDIDALGMEIGGLAPTIVARGVNALGAVVCGVVTFDV